MSKLLFKIPSVHSRDMPPPPLPPLVSGHLIIWDDGTTWSQASGSDLPLRALETVSGQLLVVGAPWPSGESASNVHTLTNLRGLEALQVCYWEKF